MIEITLAMLSALIVGIVQIFKQFVDKRYLPLIAILLGVGGIFLLQLGGSIGTLILVGIGLGLSSVGLFEFGKSTLAGK